MSAKIEQRMQIDGLIFIKKNEDMSEIVPKWPIELISNVRSAQPIRGLAKCERAHRMQ